ncbi:hypothetical protein [Geodermatophilus normandii]|uniref:Uncharacterized protein n=1 Tax=Geodermatophilus normandii TaxID=1137989 RepID=A0A6P0GLH7_9ACTN|nr:hypothetical protein [Geodermatophilus normandii]NEM08179.1 hypothetical protein [Geodermatophilus normandii]
MDLDEVAGDLYALPPEGFVAARTEAARGARAAGDRGLAREIGALGKPSTAAWACNALVQEAPDEIAGLVELGDLLREAQQTLAGDELRQLGAQRSRLLAALTRQARAVAARRGHPLSDAVADQVEETLRAALADPDAGEALLAGRLTAPLSTRGTGFGSRPDLRVVPQPRPGRTAPPPRLRGTGREDAARRAAQERRRAAQERRERELAAAREEAEEAEQAAAEAEEAARAAAERAGRAARRQEELTARAEELAAELERVRGEAASAESEAARAARRSSAADRTAERAADDRARAAARVTELEQAPLETSD